MIDAERLAVDGRIMDNEPLLRSHGENDASNVTELVSREEAINDGYNLRLSGSGAR